MEVKTQTEKTYDVMGLTESQAKDLLYFAKKLDGDVIAVNGRQKEFIGTLRTTLLNAGVQDKKVTE